MKDIIEAVDRNLIKKELTKKAFLRPTNKADNDIYDITAREAPYTMREIARLREVSYRASGGSTGNEMDIDEMDTALNPYHQLIVWDRENEEIIGGYRYLCCDQCKLDSNGQPLITSAHLYHYSEYFIRNYLPYTIELGRAFVQPKYQDRSMGVKSLFALDNIWDGIGAVLYNHPNMRYLIGKVTIYPDYDETSRNLIYTYLRRFHNDSKGLFSPYHPVEISCEAQEIADDLFIGTDPTFNYQLLQRAIRARGSVIPPMFSAYLNVTGTLESFGNAINDELSNVYETGILVKVEDINQNKYDRYIGAYIEYLKNIKNIRDLITNRKKQ